MIVKLCTFVRRKSNEKEKKKKKYVSMIVKHAKNLNNGTFSLT